MRLDLLVSEKEGITRTRAQYLIKTGGVSVDGRVVLKPASEIRSEEIVTVIDTIRYASLGGLKLENALISCKQSVEGKVCLDVGAANGGFTDCLLRYGAAKVVAADLTIAFPEDLAKDPRVVLLDGVNAKDLCTDLDENSFDFLTADLSFISLNSLFPVFYKLLKSDGILMALFKPQFEVGRKFLPKSGVVRDKKAIKKAFQAFISSAENSGFRALANVPVPDVFPDKNEERTVFFRKECE